MTDWRVTLLALLFLLTGLRIHGQGVLSMSLDRTVYFPGEEIIITLTLTNPDSSPKDISFQAVDRFNPSIRDRRAPGDLWGPAGLVIEQTPESVFREPPPDDTIRTVPALSKYQRIVRSWESVVASPMPLSVPLGTILPWVSKYVQLEAAEGVTAQFEHSKLLCEQCRLMTITPPPGTPGSFVKTRRILAISGTLVDSGQHVVLVNLRL